MKINSHLIAVVKKKRHTQKNKQLRIKHQLLYKEHQL